MSDLHTSLLNNDMNFDQLYEIVRQELVEFQKNVDELQVLGESEIDQQNVNQVFQALKTIQLQQLNIKEKIIKLEQVHQTITQSNREGSNKETKLKNQEIYIQVIYKDNSNCTRI
ncbi:unnamed protein product [Paramecium primaurelia]|uniref:Uncharacterized protein n=1 Tax=Paramecium primaurelia TaxID=5886 RepID=A0A8S1MKJ4_PARPR|nr:unnamed protein product [Paramecium primaurelia]